MRPAGTVSQRIEHGHHAGVPHIRDERRPWNAPQPCREGRNHGVPVGEHVRVIPLDGRQEHDIRAIRVEVARVLVGFDDELGSPARAGGRRHAAGELGREQRADEGRRIVTALASTQVSQPAVVLLPCVP